MSAQLAAVPNSTIGESLVRSSLLNFLQGSIHTLSAGILPDVIWGKTFEKKEEKREEEERKRENGKKRGEINTKSGKDSYVKAA